jgi:hypothetical protein
MATRATRAAKNLRLLATQLTRSVSSTAARNAILDKSPSDVVFIFAMRSAMGKAKKGQFKDIAIDELLSGLLKVFTTRLSFVISVDHCLVCRLLSARQNWIQPKSTTLQLVILLR